MAPHADDEVTAASQATTVALPVVVMSETIHVPRCEGDEAGGEVRRFERDTTDVHVSKIGLSRVLTLHDTTTDEAFALHASVAPFSAQSKPDKVVLHLQATG